VLVGFDTADDAGVYRISPELALVQTIDFFTPIVDDPFTFGQIAATNSLSDVYAMGGRPLSSLAMVCFPDGDDLSVLEQILAGGLSKMMEAGCTVIGGHSIRDPEIKFGYAVTGQIHPQRIWKNAGALPGDVLLLTKAIGTGVISTAIKRQTAQPDWIAAATRSMTTLNKAASEVVIASGAKVHGATDVTGFGLIGHAREMAHGGKVSVEIAANAIPLLPGALECVRIGAVPGGLKANREFAEGCVSYQSEIPTEIKTLLYDPQTAGGLLLAVAAEDAEKAQAAIQSAGALAARVGRVLSRGDHPLVVV